MPDVQPKAQDDPNGVAGAGETGAAPDKAPAPAIPERPAAASTGSAATPRNPMFTELVQGEEDLAGLVGYALYKMSKRDWLAAFIKTHGREPTEDEIESYILGERTQRRLTTYRRLADELIGRRIAAAEKSASAAAATPESPQSVAAVRANSLRSSLPVEAQGAPARSAFARSASDRSLSDKSSSDRMASDKPRRSGVATLIFWVLVLLVLAAAVYYFPSYSSLLTVR